MNDLRTAAQQALEALEDLGMKHCEITGEVLHKEAYTALRAALEQPEPVEWRHAGAMPPEQEAMKEAAYELTLWLSAVLDDPRVCQAYKDAINGWFDTAMPVPLEQWVQKQEPVARMHEDGSGRVITQRTYAEAQRQGGAPWSSVKNYTIPLYTHPAEPEPPPEPLHEDKIRAEFREMDRCCLPGEMTVEDWFMEGVRFAEKHHEIV